MQLVSVPTPTVPSTFFNSYNSYNGTSSRRNHGSFGGSNNPNFTTFSSQSGGNDRYASTATTTTTFGVDTFSEPVSCREEKAPGRHVFMPSTSSSAGKSDGVCGGFGGTGQSELYANGSMLLHRSKGAVSGGSGAFEPLKDRLNLQTDEQLQRRQSTDEVITQNGHNNYHYTPPPTNDTGTSRLFSTLQYRSCTNNNNKAAGMSQSMHAAYITNAYTSDVNISQKQAYAPPFLHNNNNILYNKSAHEQDIDGKGNINIAEESLIADKYYDDSRLPLHDLSASPQRPRKSVASSSSSKTPLLRAAKSETNIRTNSAKLMNGGSKSRSAMLSDQELYQVQLMYSGRGTQASDWELAATGVPVVILDQGESKVRSYRRVVIVLAEKGTGFSLWKDQIDNLTRYTEIGKTFHTMLLSTNHSKVAGMSFDSAYSAMQFYQQVLSIVSRPENVALCQEDRKVVDHSQKPSRRHSFHNGVKKQLLRKSEISNPCCFNHVTSLKPHHLTADDNLTNTISSHGPKRAQSCTQIDADGIKLPSPTRSF